jgi:hypothetical protein
MLKTSRMLRTLRLPLTLSMPRSASRSMSSRSDGYLKFHTDGLSDIHIAYTEGNPGSFVNSVYYLRYRADAFHRADGTRVAGIRSLPLAPSDGERVYDARPSGVRAWVWDIAARSDGRPVIVYALFPPGNDCIYMYAHWTGSAWQHHRIAAGGGRIGRFYAPGISLDHENPDVVSCRASKATDSSCNGGAPPTMARPGITARSAPARTTATAFGRSPRAAVLPSATSSGCRAATTATPTTKPTSSPTSPANWHRRCSRRRRRARCAQHLRQSTPPATADRGRSAALREMEQN